MVGLVERATGKAGNGNGNENGNGKREFALSCRGRGDSELSVIVFTTARDK